MSLFRCIAVLVSLVAPAATAEPATTLSFAHLFSNDFIGDGQDRWHTGSYVFSVLKQLGNSCEAGPSCADDVLEFRFRSEIIAPSNLARPAPSDRPYAGVLAFGIHHHTQRRGVETAVGVDLVTVGDQTGMLSFQSGFHHLFGAGEFGSVSQIGNATYPTLVGELGKSIELSEHALMRPFVAAQAGVETFIRAGVDVEFGQLCIGNLKIRDVTTGQRYPAIACRDAPPLVASMGLDVARVFDSHYLPSDIGPSFSSTRYRVRFGIHRTGRLGSVFFGLTWLGEEFRGQPGGQLVGSISANIRF